MIENFNKIKHEEFMREALKEAEESLNILKKYSPEDAEIMLKGKR